KSTQTNPEAYRLYLQGQYFGYKRDPDSMRRAIDLFQQAVDIDPGYAPAWAELAYTYQWYTGTGNLPIEEGAARWKKAADMALVADPNYGWAHFVNGVSLLLYDFNVQEGAKFYLRAYELDPGNSMIASARGFIAAVLGQYPEALEYTQAAIALDPVTPELHTYVGSAHWSLQQFEQAIAAYRKALELSPGYPGNHQRIARVLLQQNKPEAALEAAKGEPSHVYGLTARSMAYFALGDIEESDLALNELIENSAETGAYQIAEIYGMRDNADKAFEWLERSYDNRDSGTINMMGDPSFFGLRSDPRYAAFVRKLGLEDIWQSLPYEWGGPQS
ncbi:MAG: tetratricopeptide repeat protein, partial [Gammaproteobacteria bacterium]